MYKRRKSILIVVILAIVVFVLSQCQPQPPDEFPEPEYNEGEPLPPAQQRPQVEIGAEQALVNGQVMLTGGAEDIRNVVDVVNETTELRLTPVLTTQFTYLEEYPPPDGEQPDIRQQSRGKRQPARDPLVGRLQDVSALEITLLEFPLETHSVSEAIDVIAGVILSGDVDMEMGVVAQPNYVTGFEITGSPWSVEGSPWSVEGSPGPGANPSPGVTYANDEFWMQWALREPAGIHLFNGAEPLEGRTLTQEGQGVEVVVFDTSPFEREGQYTFAGWGRDGVDPLSVTVSHPLTLPRSDAADISDHGLFVSGLVYAVAPASNIHLVEVLNDQGQGEVQALIDTLNVYMRNRLSSNGSLENTVVNLSLGTHEPDQDELPEPVREQIELMLREWGYQVPDEGPLPVLALDVMMRLFDIYGASVIAASGNHSAEEAQPLPSQLPAAFSTVVGVTSNNKLQSQSCYANNGEIMAPGGDGGNGDADADGVEDAAPADGNTCVPTHMTCASVGAECDFGVVSYSWKEYRGFAYWVGTSFATPLVSGLAANVMEAGVNRPGDVQDLLLCSAEGNGVVDAVEALNRCLTSR